MEDTKKFFQRYPHKKSHDIPVFLVKSHFFPRVSYDIPTQLQKISYKSSWMLMFVGKATIFPRVSNGFPSYAFPCHVTQRSRHRRCSPWPRRRPSSWLGRLRLRSTRPGARARDEASCAIKMMRCGFPLDPSTMSGSTLQWFERWNIVGGITWIRREWF